MNEAHQRFREWLTGGAEGDPPRDVAVHASVCAECLRSIAALDLLAMVNPGMASMPAEQTGREWGRLVMAGRLVGATAVLFSAAILGVGVSQLIGVSHPNGPLAQASPGPDQNVLGETATAQPSQGATPTAAQETLTPLGTPEPSPQPPVATPRPYVPPPPTPVPTVVPTPIPLPSDTPAPTDSPPPAPTPTPAPTVPDAPVLVASTGVAGGVDLSWTTPNDGGDGIVAYDLYYSNDTLVGSFAFGTNATTDTNVTPGLTYSYYVVARNSVGSSVPSNTASAVAG